MPDMIDKLQICKVRNVKTPTRGTPVAAGLDFYVPDDLTVDDMKAMFSKTNHVLDFELNAKTGFVTRIIVKPGQSACIPSGIKARIPDGYCMEFHNKSGVACKKSLIAGSQTIDSDYLGEWHIDVHNVSSVNAASIAAGEKIAQFLMYRIECPSVDVIDSEEELFDGVKSERGEGAFGSTGTN